MPFPSWEAIVAYLRDLAAALPEMVALEEAGQSVGGRPVWLVRVTDCTVADEDKQVVLAVAQEHGEERSAALALLDLLEWLVTPAAASLRRSHVVALMPLVNPDAWENRDFGNRNGTNLFSDYALDGPCSQPEAEAVRQTLERLHPEVLANLHGRSTGSAIRAVEGSGLAYATSQYERAHAHLFVEEVARAAEAAGYPQDRGEEDAERIVPWIPGAEHQCFGSMFALTAGVYAYHRCHTLSVCMEVQEPASGVVRMQRLLLLGQERWRTEGRAGYPVNVMAWNCHGFLCAAGRTAAELRASREDLWRRQGECAFAYGVPARVGFDLAAFSPHLQDKTRWGAQRLSVVLDGLQDEADLDLPQMLRFAEGLPDLVFLLTEERGKPEAVAQGPTESLRAPVGLRLRLPGQVRVKAVQVNGRELAEGGGLNAYSVWDTPNGFRMVQADLAPDFSASGRLVMMVRWQ
jgi:hypothetical protein